MAQKAAEDFIREVVKNRDVRKILYQHDSSAEILGAIKTSGYDFKLYEFEEGINKLKVESPTEDQSMMLSELLQLWNLLMLDGSIVEDPKTCSPAKCFSCTSCG